jgi:hypothetical protein
MLGVEQQPVEAAVAHDVRRDVAAQAAPQADLQLAGGDGVLEGIAVNPTSPTGCDFHDFRGV